MVYLFEIIKLNKLYFYIKGKTFIFTFNCDPTIVNASNSSKIKVNDKFCLCSTKLSGSNALILATDVPFGRFSDICHQGLRSKRTNMALPHM